MPIIAAGLVILGASCASPARHRTAAPAVPTTAAAATTAAATTSTSTISPTTVVAVPPPPPRGGPSPSAAQLQAALLSQAEVGAPFTSAQYGTGSDSPTASGCPGLARELDSRASRPGVVSQEADFGATNMGPFVGEILLTEAARQLDADYRQLGQDMQACPRLTLVTDGISIDFRLTPTDFSPGASAVRMDGALHGLPVFGYLAAQQIGRAGLAFVYVQIGLASKQPALRIYTAAAAKATAQLG